MLKTLMRLAVVWCVLSMATSALAEGFALYEYSARGVALGGAVMARKPDASAVAFNPALLTRLPGVNAAAGVSVIYPRGKMDWKDPNLESTRLKHSIWPIPHFYYTHQINDSFTFGIGEFTRFGLGFEYPHDWPGRFNIYEVSLMSASLNPNIAWAVTDKLSLAVGAELIYVDLDLKKRNKNALSATDYMETDSSITNATDLGIGFNLAAHYQFNEQWAVGVQYRSQARVHAHGDVEFSYLGVHGPNADALDPTAQMLYRNNFKDGTAHSTVILPDSVAFGVSWTPVPEFSIEVGAIWTQWSTFRNLNIHLPDMPTAESKKHWRNVWRFNVGVEYDLLDWLTLRAGYAYDQSPMVEPYDDYLVPTGNRHIYSGGIGLNLADWKLDFSYSIIKPRARSYKASQETMILDSKTRNSYTQTFNFTVAYTF